MLKNSNDVEMSKSYLQFRELCALFGDVFDDFIWFHVKHFVIFARMVKLMFSSSRNGTQSLLQRQTVPNHLLNCMVF